MNLKALLPFLTAAAGAGASYYFLGKEKKGDKRVPREGLEPWATAVGGALVGYVAGQFVASRVPAAPVAAPAPVPALPASSDSEFIDIGTEAPQPIVLPATPSVAATDHTVDTRADDADDSELLNSMGSLAGSGEDGMGSYEGAYGDVDELDVEALIRESGMHNN